MICQYISVMIWGCDIVDSSHSALSWVSWWTKSVFLKGLGGFSFYIIFTRIECKKKPKKQTKRRTNGRMDGQEFPLCSTVLRPLRGRCPASIRIYTQITFQQTSTKAGQGYRWPYIACGRLVIHSLLIQEKDNRAPNVIYFLCYSRIILVSY